MNGYANGHTHAPEEHIFDSAHFGPDTLCVHAGVPTHRCSNHQHEKRQWLLSRRPLHLETSCQASRNVAIAYRSEGAAIVPIYQTATFGYHGVLGTQPPGEFSCVYTRPADNPNHRVLAAKIAAIEGTEDAIVVASGMAAISSTMTALLRPGDHFLTQAQLYGSSFALFHSEFKQLGIQLTVVDIDKPETWKDSLRSNTKGFYVEGISNPKLEVGDLKAVVAFSKEHKLTSVIDATFTPPINFKPISIGFDVVLHSATKYANGHSDIVAGIVAGSKGFIAKVTEKVAQYGGTLDPHAAFLLQRGMATLGLRVRQQNKTGLAVAQFLESHPKVKTAFYPGLKSSKGSAFAKELFTGCGGVVSAELHGGEEAASTFIHALKIPLIAPSLGGVESLVTIPAQTTHRCVSPEDRQAAGISDSLVRIAFGIEDTEDLVKDVEQALAKVKAAQ